MLSNPLFNLNHLLGLPDVPLVCCIDLMTKTAVEAI
jgi:hypothetical protein